MSVTVASGVCSLFLLIKLWICSCEDMEIFNSDKLTSLRWSPSEPRREWTEVALAVHTQTPVPVLQACGRRMRRTLVGQWLERGDAHHLLLDVSIAQEAEPSNRPIPLQLHLIDSDIPVTTFRDGGRVLYLNASTPFPASATRQPTSYLSRRVGLRLGPVRRRGFQLAFSFTGTCVLLTSIRIYYQRCPDLLLNQVSFRGTGAGARPQAGTCVRGAVELAPPVRQCTEDGLWGLQQGRCTCGPGYQAINHTCQACRVGFYRAAVEPRACRACPPNSGTLGEGADSCECLPGFQRLPGDPESLVCTRAPSAPINVSARHLNNSSLLLSWDPPLDLGGWDNVTYQVTCEEETMGRWKTCGGGVVILPINTSAVILGLDSWRNYRLSVQSWSEMGNLQGVPHSASVTIHHWPLSPAATGFVSWPPQDVGVALPGFSQLQLFLIVGSVLGSVVLVIIILTAVRALLHNYTKLSSDLETELLQLSAAVTYQRPQTEEEIDPPQFNNSDEAFQLLGMLDSNILDGLTDILVQRNQLTLGKELGKGEFGSVFEGIFSPEAAVDIHVAVKTMKAGIYSLEDLQDFLKEAEIMKNFHHENVVRLLGVTLQRHHKHPLPVPLVILPYMKHGDLHRFLIATRYGDIPMFVPHQRLLLFMMDVAAGMDYLSGQGFLHRDLAARNCMLGDDLRVCVADFGLSKQTSSRNYYRQKVSIRLPIKWMSMEALSESLYTSKSDVWSFGITMWEIVSRGRTPYAGVHNHELLDLLQSGYRLKPPEDCDHNLYQVMRGCWDRDPARRPSFRDLHQALRALLDQLPALEAHMEANYINQSLQVTANLQDLQTNSEDRCGNMYLPWGSCS